MKYLLILAAVLSLGFGARANHFEKASIVIRSEGNIPLIVILDGHRSHQQPNTVVQFNNVRPGRHHVNIYRLNRHGQYGQHGYPREELVYSGPVRARQGYRTVYKFRHGHLYFINQKPFGGYGHGNGHGFGHDYGHGQGHGTCGVHGTYNCGCSGYPLNDHPQWGPPINDHGCYHGRCSGQCGGSCGYGGGSYYNGGQYGDWDDGYPNGYDGNSGYDGQWRPVGSGFIRSLISRSKRHFDDARKVSFFLRELDGKYVTTSQVGTLADELFFEQHKYHLLTSLYDSTVDPEQYGDLGTLFLFNRTKGDFEEYVRRNKK